MDNKMPEAPFDDSPQSYLTDGNHYQCSRFFVNLLWICRTVFIQQMHKIDPSAISAFNLHLLTSYKT